MNVLNTNISVITDVLITLAPTHVAVTQVIG